MGLTRRAFLAATAALAVPSVGAERKRSEMGVAIAAYSMRWNGRVQSTRYPGWVSALQVLEHCHALGAGGIQIWVRNWQRDFAAKVRDRREALGMYLEGQISLPREDADAGRFEAELCAAKEAGATVLRTAIGNRRYEDFDTVEAFNDFREKARRSLELAEPLVAKHRLKLAIENHKDWRVPDLLDMLRRLSSEYVGVTLDFGNSIALLEDPMQVVESLAPHTFSVHIKDMGVQEYERGFLLSEVPLGDGLLDLAGMMAICRRHNAGVRFNLEMITRDPLRVPCLDERFFATFPEVAARDLAHTLTMVRARASKKPLPGIAGLNADEKLALEEEHIRRCFAYASDQLKL